MSTQSYRKHFIPLESNPEVFTNLIHRLGVSPSFAFEDVLTLDDPTFLPHEALALVLVFPTSEAYEAEKAKEEATYEEYSGSGEAEDVVWFKQTINNACGLYGILHAVSNGEARKFIQPNSPLARLLDSCIYKPPEERARILEGSGELEAAYKIAAMQGDSEAPASAEDDVDFHYVCFAKSRKTGHLYELDGDRKGPIDRGVMITPGQDMLGDAGLSIVRRFIRREDGNLNFNLMALIAS